MADRCPNCEAYCANSRTYTEPRDYTDLDLNSLPPLRPGSGVVTSAPGNPMAIQPTMRRTVAWLRSLEFDTTDSGDGVTNVQSGMEGAQPFPHVFMRTDTENMVAEGRRLLAAAEVELQAGTFGVEVSWSPQNDIVVLSLTGVTDATPRNSVMTRLVRLSEQFGGYEEEANRG